MRGCALTPWAPFQYVQPFLSITQVSSPEMRALIAHPVLTSLPSAWWPRENCHKHFSEDVTQGALPASLVVEGTPAVPQMLELAEHLGAGFARGR